MQKQLERKRKKIVNWWQNKVSSLKEKIDLLEKKSDNCEQFSQKNCLLVHGDEKQEQGNTDNIVLNITQNL